MIIKAPLPFRGQKSQWLKTFTERIQHITNVDTFVDLFGGSGLLAHWCKRLHPNCRVIYNDYDNYTNRLAHIPETNALFCKLRTVVAEDCRNITPEQKQKIIDLITESEKQNGFVDWITLSAALLFSGKYATNYKDFTKNKFYNTIPKQLYSAEGYLDGIEVVKHDYRDAVRLYNNKGVCFLVDPPYLSTQCSAYNNMEYWGLKDYLDVCNCLANMDNFIYFSSDRSQIVELFEYMQTNFAALNPFANAERYYKRKVIAHNVNGYTDTMYIKTTAQNDIKKPLTMNL